MDEPTKRNLDHVYGATAAVGAVAVVAILILVLTWRPVCI
jgi:hypothetical protein